MIRAFLIWMLVLAVPAQGAAAATMAFCGPNHHGGELALSTTTADPSAHADHGAEQMSEGHSVPSADVPAADDESTLVNANDAAKQKCSVCASCCSLGAILSTVPVIPATDSVSTVFLTVVPTVGAFAADGPDRPPRNFLA